MDTQEEENHALIPSQHIENEGAKLKNKNTRGWKAREERNKGKKGKVYFN